MQRFKITKDHILIYNNEMWTFYINGYKTDLEKFLDICNDEKVKKKIKDIMASVQPQIRS